MSDINRLPPICEACETQYGLTLLACCGGAAGDVYLCPDDMRDHLNSCEACNAERLGSQDYWAKQYALTGARGAIH